MKKPLSSEELRTLLTIFFDFNTRNVNRGTSKYWNERTNKAKKNYDIFSKGSIPKAERILDINMPVPVIGTFCEAHASYVMKSRPKIQCTPLGPDEGDAILANKREKVLNSWWDNYSIFHKLREAVVRGTYQNEVAVCLEEDKANNNYNLKVLNENYVIVSEDINDPFSRARYILRRVEFDKKAFIRYTSKNPDTSKGTEFIWGPRVSEIKIMDFEEFVDGTYKYLLYNREIIYFEEHKMEILPYYKIQYFRSSISLLDSLKGLGEMLQYFLNAQVSLTNRQIKMPPVIKGNGNILSMKEQEFVQVENAGNLTIPEVPNNLVNVKDVVFTIKTMMHFVSGLSEEGMAGFSGALDVAGVSIELRMDSTIRRAVVVQGPLKSMIEQINRDYLMLMKRNYPNTDLSTWSKLGKIEKDKVTVDDLGGVVENKISFAPVTPRSVTQERQSLIAMVQNNLISLETALDRLGEDDPILQKSKIEKEMSRKALLAQAMQQGIKTENDPLSPEEEVAKIVAGEDVEYNLALTVNVDQKPYLEAIDKELAKSNNLRLLSWRSRRLDIQKSQLGKVNMAQEQKQDSPQNVVSGQRKKLVPSSVDTQPQRRR